MNAIKEMIRSLLNEMGGASAAKETVATEQNKAENPPVPEEAEPAVSLQEEVKQDTSVIEDGIIPDITEVDIQEQFLVPNAINEEAYRKIKKFTPARLGLWRAGDRYKTQSVLRFRADHAAAQDAVFSYVSDDFIKEMGFIPVQTKGDY